MAHVDNKWLNNHNYLKVLLFSVQCSSVLGPTKFFACPSPHLLELPMWMDPSCINIEMDNCLFSNLIFIYFPAILKKFCFSKNTVDETRERECECKAI